MRFTGYLLILLLASLLLPNCGPTGRDRCYDDCSLRAALCFNVLDVDFAEKVFFCGQDQCFESCDAKAEAAAARAREQNERDRSAGN